MNSLFGSNIDDVRTEIMRLETAPHFDADAWSRVLADLSTAGRVAGLADAQRRMETARSNQLAVAVETPDAAYFVGIDFATGQDRTVRGNGKSTFHADIVADIVETDYNADGKLKAYWVQIKDDDWGMWIHAETAGKAKKNYLDMDPSVVPGDFTYLRATRPEHGADLLDCTPFTDDTLALAGYRYENEDFTDPFLDFCPCSMCRFEKTKPEYQVGYQKVEVQHG